MKYERFTHTNLKNVRKEIDEKLAELKALGLNIQIGTISYNDNSFTTKLTCTVDSAGDMYAAEYNRKCSFYGMPNGIVGTTFAQGTKTYKFRGFKPNARTKIAIYEDVYTNALFVTSIDQLKKYLKY